MKGGDNMLSLRMSMTCDEYIPTFLAGKLNKTILFDKIDDANIKAQEYMDRFTLWLESDPSCNTPAKYTTTINHDTKTNSTVYECDINGVIFKIEIAPTQYQAIYHDLVNDIKVIINEGSDIEEHETVIRNDMENWIDSHTNDTENNFLVDFDNKWIVRKLKNGSSISEAKWAINIS